jgi:hypothetical protein
MIGSVGGYLDGGANASLQRLALPSLDLDFLRRDPWAMQVHFRKERDFLLKEFLEEVVGIFVQWSTSCGDS